MKKLTVLLDEDFHRRLRLFSVATGESLQKLTIRLLQEELARSGSVLRTAVFESEPPAPPRKRARGKKSDQSSE